jgi:hypothetical protein
MVTKTIVQKKIYKDATVATLRQMSQKWPSTFVARSEISKFSGGLLASGTAANNDSAGTGIPGAFRVSRKIAYPVDSAIEWLISRLEG